MPGRRGVIAFAALIWVLANSGAFADATSSELTDTTIDANSPREANGRTADLLSAFFGLDNGLLRVANRICPGAAGKDGMPVIFSTEVDHTTLQAGDFEVIKASGERGTMHCASFLPATDAGELRTVLLVGDFGDADADPPASVRILGHVHSIDGTLDFNGATVAVTPLDPGPSMIMAEILSNDMRDVGLGIRRTRGTSCPEDGVAQAIRVVWAGGVTLEGGDEPGQDVGALYRVTVEASDGTQRDVTPIALADLGDGDNNHLLCLETEDRPLSVFFPAGVLTDPNDDLNPATTVDLLP